MKRSSVCTAVATISMLCAACGGGPTRPIPLAPPQELGEPVPLPEDPRREFDFWVGEWGVVNLRAQRDGSWEQSGMATARIQSAVDGGALVEQWISSDDTLIGFSLRAYDEAADQWSVWLNWTNGGPNSFSEMRGQRNGERIELFRPDGSKNLRYSFAEARTESCQWEQATSKDGQTWITDWMMHFTRRGDLPPVDAGNAPVTPPHESTSRYSETRALDFLLGAWEGGAVATAADGAREEGTVRARFSAFNRGLGLLQYLDTGWGEKNVMALGFDPGADGWVGLHVDNRDGEITRMAGDVEPRGATFTAVQSGLRENWSCSGDDVCSWWRESSADGGATWVTTVEAELRRSESTAAWIDIRNARTPFDQVLTGGQATADQLAWAARNGYRTIVNLRGPDEEGELAGEAALVEDLGMRYVAIPMSSKDDLNAENASKLAQALEAEDALPAMVHCASGNRVGALFGLKAHLEDGLDAQASLGVARDAGITRMEPILRQSLGLPPVVK